VAKSNGQERSGHWAVGSDAARLEAGMILEPTLESFRQEVSDFCQRKLPRDIRRKVALNLTLERDDHARWQKLLHERAWMVVKGGAR
jgi:hypothetical protein